MPGGVDPGSDARYSGRCTYLVRCLATLVGDWEWAGGIGLHRGPSFSEITTRYGPGLIRTIGIRTRRDAPVIIGGVRSRPIVGHSAAAAVEVVALNVASIQDTPNTGAN